MTRTNFEALKIKPTPFTFELEDFSDPEIPLKLIRPLKLNVTFENGKYFVESEELNMFTFNHDLEKVISDLEWYFFALWENYVLEKDEKLASSGLRFKKLIQTYAEEKHVL
ncbi:hypothetical protein [Methanolapillus millepedarum]